MLVSIISPFYNEQQSIKDFTNCLFNIEQEFDSRTSIEFIFVDDGSSDLTYKILCEINKSNIKVLRLAKNYGHQTALQAGLSQAKGDLIITLDSDLQHPPQLIPKMIDLHLESKADIINAVREKRNGEKFLKRFTARNFYRIIKVLSGVSITQNAADFRLVTRRVLAELLEIGGGAPFYRLVIPQMGLPTECIFYESVARLHSDTKFSIKKMSSLAWKGLLQASIRPLRIMALLGFAMSLAAFIWIVYVVFRYMTVTTSSGWPSLTSIVLLLGGLNLISIALIGEYVGMIYLSLINKNNYIIREIHEN